MSFSRPIELKNASLSADKEPLVCAPLVGASEEAVLSELAAIVPKKPELLEWRVDFFSGIADTSGATPPTNGNGPGGWLLSSCTQTQGAKPTY